MLYILGLKENKVAWSKWAMFYVVRRLKEPWNNCWFENADQKQLREIARNSLEGLVAWEKCKNAIDADVVSFRANLRCKKTPSLRSVLRTDKKVGTIASIRCLGMCQLPYEVNSWLLRVNSITIKNEPLNLSCFAFLSGRPVARLCNFRFPIPPHVLLSGRVSRFPTGFFLLLFLNRNLWGK